MYEKIRAQHSEAISSAQEERKYVLEDVFWVPVSNCRARHFASPVVPEHRSEVRETSEISDSEEAELESASENPTWIDSAREFCSARNITITGWDPHALFVEAKSPERAAEISAQLADLGFQPIPDPNDDYAGILTLLHPA